ncbi:protein UL42 [Panine betaherpesvirus 2]|uniref:Protein UL42 n=1 Tax=Panine betaherpesvirus 2 TaxID=188763 RepID=Q8QS47_9BETA|nr:protein UL42 [Panine betaherpesvirus 2]AAM00691.1 protein UL42 [Panine betaherpesvirus 2]QXV67796.1 protein UL42 [Panine betaherpesvirus 2]
MDPTPILRDEEGRDGGQDDAPPSYEQAVGLGPPPRYEEAGGPHVAITMNAAPDHNNNRLPLPNCSPPPYRPPYCLMSSPPRRHTFDMDMMDIPATMHPPTTAYLDQSWKWSAALMVVAVLGIIFLAVVFTVVLNRRNGNTVTGTSG